MAKKRTIGSLRAIASALGMSRRKLLRLMRDGAPITRRGEEFEVDRQALDRWIEQHEDPGQKLARALHPSDPRFRERAATAALAKLKQALDLGTVVRIADSAARLEGELVACRAALLSLPSQMVLSPTPEALGEGIELALGNLTMDSDALPPEPSPEPEDDSWLEGMPETLPILAPSDPRHAVAQSRAERQEHRLAALQAETKSAAKVQRDIARHYAEIRTRVRKISGTDHESVAQAVHEALTELSA